MFYNFLPEYPSLFIFKEFIMKKRFLVVLALSPVLLNAEIRLINPAQGEIISTAAPVLRSYMELEPQARLEFYADLEKREQLHQARNPAPVIFKWECTNHEKGKFKLLIAADPQFTTTTEAFVLPAAKDQAPHEARVVNFRLGETCYWKVECQTEEGKTIVSKTGTFQTFANPPRLMAWPSIKNVRDIGGYPGANGRRVRQGMIYRSEGLNSNSPDYKAIQKKEGWTPEQVAEHRLGRVRLKPDTLDYLHNVIGLKTDLELRSYAETGPLKESPAGSKVRFVHNPIRPYNDFFVENDPLTSAGPQAVANAIRVFCDADNYPVVIHCIAGADRTGCLAFVINAVLGVDEADLRKDWEITAFRIKGYEKKMDKFIAGFNAFGTPEDSIHKKVEAFLLQAGVTPAELTSLRNIMLE